MGGARVGSRGRVSGSRRRPPTPERTAATSRRSRDRPASGFPRGGGRPTSGGGASIPGRRSAIGIYDRFERYSATESGPTYRIVPLSSSGNAGVLASWRRRLSSAPLARFSRLSSSAVGACRRLHQAATGLARSPRQRSSRRYRSRYRTCASSRRVERDRARCRRRLRSGPGYRTRSEDRRSGLARRSGGRRYRRRERGRPRVLPDTTRESPTDRAVRRCFAPTGNRIAAAMPVVVRSSTRHHRGDGEWVERNSSASAQSPPTRTRSPAGTFRSARGRPSVCIDVVGHGITERGTD